MKKGFTLIELLVVIIIVAIMMAITMRFNGNFVYDIEFKKAKDKLVGDYHQILGHNMSSRYIGSQGYESYTVTIANGTNMVEYNYLDKEGNSLQQESKTYAGVTVNQVAIAGQAVDKLQLQFLPYQLWCSIGDSDPTETTAASFQIQANKTGKRFCFTLDSNTCKILSFVCPDEERVRYFGN